MTVYITNKNRFRKLCVLTYVLCVMSILLLASCSANPDIPKRRHHHPLLIPTSSGNPYEVMVVADDSLWNGYVGEALQAVLNKDVPMLPQSEPMFNVSHVNSDNFNRITNLFRNIIVIRIDNTLTQPKFIYERDLYSSPQLVITMQSPSADELSTYITEHTKSIIQNISAEEINRNATRLEEDYNIKFYRKCKEMFGCELFIPNDLLKMKIGKDFLWASNDGLATIQNICVYSYPYISKKEFTQYAYVALRDTFMKRNIPGDKPNQYMTTNHDYVQTTAKSVLGRYVMEARGLWRIENDMMGGPFVSHSTVDTVNNRVIVVEGFVYAPEKMKRTMIRRLEAALYTLRLPAAKEDNKNDKQKK